MFTIVRGPRSSEMSLSTQVKESIENAANCMRDALAFAARTEHPITITTISDILCRLESLEQVDDLMQQFAKKDDHKTNHHRGWTPRKIFNNTTNTWANSQRNGAGIIGSV